MASILRIRQKPLYRLNLGYILKHSRKQRARMEKSKLPKNTRGGGIEYTDKPDTPEWDPPTADTECPSAAPKEGKMSESY